MRGLLLQLVCLSALGLSGAAYADSIPAGTYYLNNVTVQDSTNQSFALTGNVTIGANGLFSAANITLNDASLGSPVFNVISSTGTGGYAPAADFAYVTAPGKGQLTLYYLPTLDAQGNIDLCIANVTCNTYQASSNQIYAQSSFGYNPVDLSGGTLSSQPLAGSTSPVPEPASLALLGTGILGLAVAAKRWPVNG